MNRQQWIAKCNDWKNKWPTIIPEYKANNEDYVFNLYAVLDAINKYSRPEDILMGDAGSISYAGPVALETKPGQRMIFSPAQADMGWALPAAVGVAMASKQPVIAIVGDGSFMSNVQELAVIRQHNLNIKFFILNNEGYLSIKNTQSKYYDGRVYGTSTETGIWFPSFYNVAGTFGLRYVDMRLAHDLLQLPLLLESPEPMIIDCKCLSSQEILPAQALRDGKQVGLHDMTPFLPDDVLKQEMLVEL